MSARKTGNLVSETWDPSSVSATLQGDARYGRGEEREGGKEEIIINNDVGKKTFIITIWRRIHRLLKFCDSFTGRYLGRTC